MEYKIVKTGNIQHLESLVNEHIREGWEPMGTFVCITYSDKPMSQMEYGQPMIRITRQQLND